MKATPRFDAEDLRVGSFGERTTGDRFTVIYRKGTEDESVIRLILGPRPPRVVRWYSPRPDDVIVDVGAHIGIATLNWADRVPEGQVFSVEPSRESYALLQANLVLNGLENVSAARLALLDTTGEVELHHSEFNSGHTVMKELSGQRETVSTRSLGEFFGENGIEHCNLLKLNCEGAELPILLGSPVDLLRRVERMIVLWHGDLIEVPDGLRTLEDQLEEAGFELDSVAQSGARALIFATLGQ